MKVMRRSAATIDTKMESALDFLRDPRALEGITRNNQIFL